MIGLSTEGLGQTSRFLENALTRHMQKRLQKSYPSISLDALVKARAERDIAHNLAFVIGRNQTQRQKAIFAQVMY